MIGEFSQDAQILLEIIRRDDPELYNDIMNRSREAQMMRLGSTGGNLFYAHKYMSCIHYDHDKTRAITGQLARKENGHDFHFAIAKYKFLLCTEVGAVWLVSHYSRLCLPSC